MKFHANGALTLGIVLASPRDMSSVPFASTYAEPTVMWRMQRGRHLSAHAVIGFQATGAWVMWFVNNRPVGKRYFEDCDGALRWSDRLKAQNWSVGWRLLADADQSPSSQMES